MALASGITAPSSKIWLKKAKNINKFEIGALKRMRDVRERQRIFEEVALKFSIYECLYTITPYQNIESLGSKLRLHLLRFTAMKISQDYL